MALSKKTLTNKKIDLEALEGILFELMQTGKPAIKWENKKPTPEQMQEKLIYKG